MKKLYLAKTTTLAAAALMMAGCSHDAWHQRPDQTAETAKAFEANFKNVVMEGRDIAPEQTWSTAVSTEVTITSAKSGTLKVYAQDPVGSSPAVYYSAAINRGEAKTFTIARPQGVETLYAVVTDSEGYILDNMAFAATGAKVSAAFYDHEDLMAPAFSTRRAIASSYQFPDDADAGKFLADVPASVKSYDEVNPWGYASGISYIENRSTEVNIWGAWDGTRTSGGTLYVKGYCDLSKVKFYVAPNTDVYLVEGATLILGSKDNSNSNLQGGCNYYIARGAKLATADDLELVLNNGIRIYNHGTIEAGKLSVNNSSVLYNASTVKVNGELSTENGNSVIVNDGTIEATRLHTAGSSHVENNGTANISGNTDIDSNNNTWVNNGQYTTGNFYYTAGSCDVINNCRLTVGDLFRINLGDTDRNGFRMDAGCGVVTKRFEAAGPCFIFMGSNSVFEVQETATMNITKDVYGIYGPKEGDPAVFTAKEIANGAADPNQCFVANYFQQLVVATDKHFAQGYSDGTSDAAKANGGIGSQPYYHIGRDARLVENGVADIHIDATTCNPGFSGGGKKKEETTQYVYFAFEDLGTDDDFDFNDVVVRIATPDASGQAKVELCAVGGTLETYVYNGTQRLGDEVHTEFGCDFSTYAVDNKGNTNQSALVTPFKEIAQVTVAAGSSVADLPISIRVKQNGQERTITAPAAGEVPFRIVVTGDDQGKWHWAKERVNISEAHTDFGLWGANVNVAGWHLHPVAEKVVNW
jgi:hypothetical protein